MPSSRRLIDDVPTVPRKSEMKVLALGLSRTGTNSLRIALNELGYNSYHMFDVMKHEHGRFWSEAMEANFEPRTISPPYERPEFDKLLHDFDAVTDMPMALFVDDFLKAYPTAKVVLTLRDFDSWVASLRRTLFPIFSSKMWEMLYPFNRYGWGDARKCGRRSFEKFVPNGNYLDTEQLRSAFEAHYKHVRAVVPKEQLLEFRSKDGWEPLCKFLGKDIPPTPFPKTNDATSFVSNFDTYLMVESVKALLKVLVGGGGMAVFLAMAWKYLPKSLES